MEEHGVPERIHCSETTYLRAKKKFEFEDRYAPGEGPLAKDTAPSRKTSVKAKVSTTPTLNKIKKAKTIGIVDSPGAGSGKAETISPSFAAAAQSLPTAMGKPQIRQTLLQQKLSTLSTLGEVGSTKDGREGPNHATESEEGRGRNQIRQHSYLVIVPKALRAVFNGPGEHEPAYKRLQAEKARILAENKKNERAVVALQRWTRKMHRTTRVRTQRLRLREALSDDSGHPSTRAGRSLTRHGSLLGTLGLSAPSYARHNTVIGMKSSSATRNKNTSSI